MRNGKEERCWLSNDWRGGAPEWNPVKGQMQAYLICRPILSLTAGHEPKEDALPNR